MKFACTYSTSGPYFATAVSHSHASDSQVRFEEWFAASLRTASHAAFVSHAGSLRLTIFVTQANIFPSSVVSLSSSCLSLSAAGVVRTVPPRTTVLSPDGSLSNVTVEETAALSRSGYGLVAAISRNPRPNCVCRLAVILCLSDWTWIAPNPHLMDVMQHVIEMNLRRDFAHLLDLARRAPNLHPMDATRGGIAIAQMKMQDRRQVDLTCRCRSEGHSCVQEAPVYQRTNPPAGSEVSVGRRPSPSSSRGGPMSSSSCMSSDGENLELDESMEETMTPPSRLCGGLGE